MKYLITLILTLFISLANAQVNSEYTYVQGYTRKDGTKVKGHYRTKPNSTINDNYSTLGNTNPWTGEFGWIKPEKTRPSTSTFIDSHSFSSSSSPKQRLESSTGSSNESWSLKADQYSYTTYTTEQAIVYHNRYTISTRLAIENFLHINGFDTGSVDGIFTYATIRAIVKLQRLLKVSADGKFGPATLNGLK